MGLIDDIARDGFSGPYLVLSPKECARLLPRLARKRPRTKVWRKASAVANHHVHTIASDPRILELVRPVLGEDIILWAAELIIRRPDTAHSFHCDVESSSADGGFLTVWLGLENTSQASGLKFVTGSHRYGATVQEMKARFGIEVMEKSDVAVLDAARTVAADATIAQPEVCDGAALVFDGRAWHGSHNSSTATRTALLLQYARADRPVFIPESFDWPFRFKAEPRPPVLVVSGRSPIGVNQIARPPGAHKIAAIANAAFDLPEARPVAHFASMPHFRGRTAQVGFVDAHSSVLAPGASPHPLHAHVEEEILVVVSGQAELLTADKLNAQAVRRETMGEGDFAYYPAFQPHTLINASDKPVLYTMLKWRNKRGHIWGKAATLTFVWASGILFAAADTTKRNQGTILNVKTRWLDRLHCHVSIVAPGVGYPEHGDRYDVAIVLFAGSIETLGKTVSAPALLYHPAHALHGMKSVGSDPARYLVFELDRSASAWSALLRSCRKLLRRRK
jgi:oxalate decarboxylase/phosphoglucose isomerase-like protein (cupin superfamily)